MQSRYRAEQNLPANSVDSVLWDRRAARDRLKWDSVVCHKETIYGWSLVLAIPLAAGVLSAQTPPVEWRRIGNASMDVGLASPATGPVLAVWYSADGSRLYARTRANRVFETIDFENWTAIQGASEPADIPPPAVDRVPESGARLAVSPIEPGRVYALGNRRLYRSDDGGRSWSNLTGFRSQSIIGTGQRSVAVSPDDPDQLVVANSFGVWRSMDGGLSWTGMNRYLPNLPAARILAHSHWQPRRSDSGTRFGRDGVGAREFRSVATGGRRASRRRDQGAAERIGRAGDGDHRRRLVGSNSVCGRRRRAPLGFARWRAQLDLLAAARWERAGGAAVCRPQ